MNEELVLRTDLFRNLHRADHLTILLMYNPWFLHDSTFMTIRSMEQALGPLCRSIHLIWCSSLSSIYDDACYNLRVPSSARGWSRAMAPWPYTNTDIVRGQLARRDVCLPWC